MHIAGLACADGAAAIIDHDLRHGAEGFGANFKKGRRADPGALGKRE
jgi:hypothetical protein